MSAIKNWEEEVYEEIVEAYKKKIGVSDSGVFEETFVYKQIIKIMRKLREIHGNDKETLKESVTNALLLIVSLFLSEKEEDDLDPGKNLTPSDQYYLKKVFSHAIDFANGKTQTAC